MTKIPFYADGLKFTCKRCSVCCRHESGYVFLSQKDLDNLADELNMDIKSFTAAYCRWVSSRNGGETLSLKEKPNKDCILWDQGCTVYSSRPVQCISFPFWDSILTSKESWKIAASDCPGMNNGELKSIETIEQYKNMRIMPVKRGEI